MKVLFFEKEKRGFCFLRQLVTIQRWQRFVKEPPRVSRSRQIILNVSISEQKESIIMSKINGRANFIWSVADLLRGPYRPNQYKDIMLPMTVLRRMDCDA